MKVTIKEVMKDLPAVDALLREPHNISFVDGDIFVDGEDTELPEEMDITITCNGIIVNDDRISIEFPDGRIADYEICSDDYSYIKII